MSHEALTFLGFLLLLVVGLGGLFLLWRAIDRGQRELVHLSRAVGGLVYQEEERTRQVMREMVAQANR